VGIGIETRSRQRRRSTAWVTGRRDSGDPHSRPKPQQTAVEPGLRDADSGVCQARASITAIGCAFGVNWIED